MAIAMGALRFRAMKFFVMCVAGNIVKAMVISYAGYLGVGTLLRWLGGA
jgi:membrane protein DedA with SNARE-associated domain